MIQYCFNGVQYFILGDPQLGILFTDFRDMCEVKDSWGCIENGVVWRKGNRIKEPMTVNNPPRKKDKDFKQLFFLRMGKYPVNDKELEQFKVSEEEREAERGWSI